MEELDEHTAEEHSKEKLQVRCWRTSEANRGGPHKRQVKATDETSKVRGGGRRAVPKSRGTETARERAKQRSADEA